MNSSPKPQTPDPKACIASVRFQPTGKLYDFDACACQDLQPGDFVLVETARGRQLGEVVSVHSLGKGKNQSLKPIQRRATGRDLALRQQWCEKEVEALAVAREAVERLELPIKIIVTEYTFDGRRLTILYVSDEKPALGKLTQQLQRKLDVHVDLRRVGPRDHAKLMKGYGACGEMRCCSRFISEFSSISIKMAKAQGISLNPSDITGMCGRLRCCLAYEHEQYKEASKAMPRRKKRVRTPYGEGKVVDLLPLKGQVVVQVEDRRLEVPAEDVELIST
ncbi:MAG: regulatory iron-sulfur-containing complex subunit RicT [Chloroflexota bacterium]|nr:regulatory iron-sulfur-containing complex subunit RicT [Chloroflexota bacterium]